MYVFKFTASLMLHLSCLWEKCTQLREIKNQAEVVSNEAQLKDLFSPFGLSQKRDHVRG